MGLGPILKHQGKRPIYSNGTLPLPLGLFIPLRFKAIFSPKILGYFLRGREVDNFM